MSFMSLIAILVSSNVFASQPNIYTCFDADQSEVLDVAFSSQYGLPVIADFHRSNYAGFELADKVEYRLEYILDRRYVWLTQFNTQGKIGVTIMVKLQDLQQKNFSMLYFEPLNQIEMKLKCLSTR